MAHVHLKKAVQDVKRGMVGPIIYSLAMPILLREQLKDREVPFSSKLFAILSIPLMAVISGGTLALGICLALAQAILFPFQCLIALIRDGMAGKPTPPPAGCGEAMSTFVSYDSPSYTGFQATRIESYQQPQTLSGPGFWSSTATNSPLDTAEDQPSVRSSLNP